jgi:hypothetical protein
MATEEQEKGTKIRVGVDQDNSLVVMEFEEKVKWVALTPDEAIGLSGIILQKVGLIHAKENGKETV